MQCAICYGTKHGKDDHGCGLLFWDVDLPCVPRIGERIGIPQEEIGGEFLRSKDGKWAACCAKITDVCWVLPTDDQPEVSIAISCDIEWEPAENC